MNIGIDARALVEKKVGFGFFLMNILEEILQIDTDNNYYFFSDREIVFDFQKYKNVKAVQYKDNFLFPKSFYYYYKLPKYIEKCGIVLDVFWGTMHIMPRGFNSRVKRILTIHDFTHLKFPKSTTKFNLLITKLFFGPSIKHSNKIVCISKNTEKELKEYYPNECKDKDIFVIYEGGYSTAELKNLSYDESEVRPEILECLKDKYMLFVGTIEPRKNIKLLIEAAPRLKDVIKVVVCGKIGWESKKVVSKLNNTDNLIYFNYITQDEKILLMKNAFCQVQPSLYEGFGLPVVESMQSETVVVVADNSSLSEIVELEALKFQTNDVEDFCRKINILNRNEEKYRICKEYCMLRGKSFSWSKAAHRYLELFSKFSV